MLRRIEPDETNLRLETSAPGTARTDPVVAGVAESELEPERLPNDHPRWVRDAIALSSRARELVQKLKPVVLRVMTLWDHRFRSIVVGDRRVTVDPSGSYRADTYR